MNSAKTWLIVVLALAALGSGWVAWTQRNEIAALRAAAMPREERAALQKRVWDLEKANRELKERPPTEPGAATAAARPARSDSSSPPRRDPDAQANAMRDLLAKPDVQALVAAQQRGAVETRYAALFRTLNLPPEQTAQLAKLLAERTTALLDIAAVARDQGVDLRGNAAALGQLVSSTQNEINQSIRGLLGEAGFAQLGAYEQTLQQRTTVSELQQRLSYTTTPLTPAQADQLVQILAANPAPRTAAPASPPGRGNDLNSVVVGSIAPPGLDATRGAAGAAITPAAVSQAQTVLSPPQTAALQQLQQQQQAQQQLRQLVTETLSPPSPPRPPGKG